MRNRTPRLAFAAVFSLLLPATTFGWGRTGHNLVATIADARLTPQARAQVKALLGNATLADVSSWADDIRRQRKETGPWHYVDVPVEAPALDLARDGRDGDNIVTRFQEYTKKLTDPALSPDERAEALKFVVHFVGDLHQPLHCAERNHDKGGNARLTFFLDDPKAVNLHSVWDTRLLEARRGDTQMTVYAKALLSRITPQQAAEWAKSKPEDWVNESHQLAVDVVYNGVPVDGPPPKLDAAYVARGQDAVDQQLEKAGVRLAMVLNRAFALSGAVSTVATTAPAIPTTAPTATVPPGQPQREPAPAGSAE